MHSLFSELRKIGRDILTTVSSLAKINSLLHVPLYSNALYLMLANVANALFGFVFWIIATRLYSTDAVGVASAIISAAALLEMLSGLGLSYGLLRFLRASDNAIKLINSTFTLTGFLSLLAACIFIIGLDIWSPGLSIIRQNPWYLAIFLLYVPILVLDDLTDPVMMAGQQAKFIFVHALIFNILRLALPVLLVVFFKSFGIFASWGAATLVGFLVSIFILLPHVQPGYRPFLMVDKKEVSKVLHFSFLNYLGDLFWTMPGLILPIIVLDLRGAESNAYFYMAWTMSSMLAMIPTAVATSLLVQGTYDEAKLKNLAGRSLKMIMVLLVPAVILVWFLADKLLMFYGGLYADNAATLLRWLAIAAFPLAINIVYFSIRRVQKNVKSIILLAVIMAFVTVLGSYLLLPRLGIDGVGIAWLGGQGITALIAIIMGAKILGAKVN
jgi:O-antigen/teichoic acid export membrane protein